jgi:hypothetical protein
MRPGVGSDRAKSDLEAVGFEALHEDREGLSPSSTSKVLASDQGRFKDILRHTHATQQILNPY